jgi:hypothetical protein
MTGQDSIDSESVIATIGDEVSDLREQSERDKSAALKSVVDAWTKQQDSERKIRNHFAIALLIFLGFQAVVLNVAFFCIGASCITVDEWTARTFIVGVFAESAGLVWFIVRYLFNDHTASVFDLIKNR